ncbi:MAG: PilZ domain-containing protein [Fibromonadaceae bacterium]|jgi:c-di-GMP-binding flagellar brake protein YcgR|nr:PilZ domain-containing protein [Fibromonadaceae bacterium]
MRSVSYKFLFFVAMLGSVFAQTAQQRSDSIKAYDQFVGSIKQAFEKDLSITFIIVAVSVIILLVVAVVFYEIRRANKAKQELLDLAWKRFDFSALKLKLSQSGITLLKKIAQEAVLQDPDSIIRSPNVFEHSLEKYYKSNKIESISKEKLAEIRSLRKAMGFLPLPREVPFISTRQFASGEKCMVQIESEPTAHKEMCQIHNSEELNWSIARPGVSRVPVGTWVSMNFTRPGDAEYTFKVQVLSDSSDELILGHSTKLNRAQQRNWVRIDVNIPVEVTQVEGNNIGDIFFGKIVDMSGGGLGMALPVKLQNGTDLRLDFALPGHGQIDKLQVKVVRVAGQCNKDPSKTVHSVAFEGEIHAIQEQIIQYVFEKQRQDTMAKLS